MKPITEHCRSYRPDKPADDIFITKTDPPAKATDDGHDYAYDEVMAILMNLPSGWRGLFGLR